MQITPLVLHATRRLPALTGLFSDAVAVTTLDVVTGGNVTVNTQYPHGVPVGGTVILTVVDIDAPNPIVGATLLAADQVKLTTQYDNDLTTRPSTATDVNAWDASVKLGGFDAVLNGTLQLLSVIDRRNFVVLPPEPVAGVTLDGGEVLYERMESEIVGYHRATATSATALTFPTPATITRSYVVQSPVIAMNPRIYGTLELATVMRVFTRDQETTPADKLSMFIAPVDVKTSRSRNSRTDAVADMSDGSDYRINVVDGFDVFVVIPTGKSMSAVAAIDAAQGPVLRAVLGTFFGLKAQMPEIVGGVPLPAVLESHGAATYTQANYVHRYHFQASYQLTNADAIKQFDWTDLPDPDWAIGGPGSGAAPGDMPSTIGGVGTSALHDIVLDPGISHDGKPGKLSGNIKVDGQ